jgi:hypothetical protein
MDEEKMLVGRLFEAEYRMQARYMSRNAAEARAALEKYLSEVAKIRLSPDDTDANEVFHRNRALAMARLEFVRAEMEGAKVHLTAAIAEMRKVDDQYARLSDQRLATALITIVRGDAVAVPWLRHFETSAAQAMEDVQSDTTATPPAP